MVEYIVTFILLDPMVVEPLQVVLAQVILIYNKYLREIQRLKN